MPQWEYKVVTTQPDPQRWFSMGGDIDARRTEETLNQAGRDGWELVSSFDTNMGHGESRNYVFLFKRLRA